MAQTDSYNRIKGAEAEKLLIRYVPKKEEELMNPRICVEFALQHCFEVFSVYQDKTEDYWLMPIVMGLGMCFSRRNSG